MGGKRGRQKMRGKHVFYGGSSARAGKVSNCTKIYEVRALSYIKRGCDVNSANTRDDSTTFQPSSVVDLSYPGLFDTYRVRIRWMLECIMEAVSMILVGTTVRFVVNINAE